MKKKLYISKKLSLLLLTCYYNTNFLYYQQSYQQQSPYGQYQNTNSSITNTDVYAYEQLSPEAKTSINQIVAQTISDSTQKNKKKKDNSAGAGDVISLKTILIITASVLASTGLIFLFVNSFFNYMNDLNTTMQASGILLDANLAEASNEDILKFISDQKNAYLEKNPDLAKKFAKLEDAIKREGKAPSITPEVESKIIDTIRKSAKAYKEKMQAIDKIGNEDTTNDDQNTQQQQETIIQGQNQEAQGIQDPNNQEQDLQDLSQPQQLSSNVQIINTTEDSYQLQQKIAEQKLEITSTQRISQYVEAAMPNSSLAKNISDFIIQTNHDPIMQEIKDLKSQYSTLQDQLAQTNDPNTKSNISAQLSALDQKFISNREQIVEKRTQILEKAKSEIFENVKELVQLHPEMAQYIDLNDPNKFFTDKDVLTKFAADTTKIAQKNVQQEQQQRNQEEKENEEEKEKTNTGGESFEHENG